MKKKVNFYNYENEYALKIDSLFEPLIPFQILFFSFFFFLFARKDTDLITKFAGNDCEAIQKRLSWKVYQCMTFRKANK